MLASVIVRKRQVIADETETNCYRNLIERVADILTPSTSKESPMVHQVHKMTENALLSSGKPADFSFRQLRIIDVAKFLENIGLEGARYTRVAGVPERGENKKFLTRSLWLNNNRLRNIQHVDELAEAVLEYPKELGWVDFSFNHITQIDECILKFKSLKILYFHGNCIADLDEVYKLRALKQLRSVTFHGNPIANHPKYRSYVISALPQIANLDFSPIVHNEKQYPAPAEFLRKFKESKEFEKTKQE